MTRLTADEIVQAVAGLSDWERSDDAIVRTVRCPTFMDGIRLVNRVAAMAEAADHHPDIDIRYRNIRFLLVTHAEGGLTEKDVNLARQINEALEQGPTVS